MLPSPWTGHFQIVFLLNKPVSALYSNGLLSQEFPPRDDLAEKFLVLCDCLSRLCTLCISNVVAQFEHLLKTFKNHSVKILQTRNSCSGERASWLFTIFSEVWWEAQCSRIPGGEWQKLTYTSPLVGTWLPEKMALSLSSCVHKIALFRRHNQTFSWEAFGSQLPCSWLHCSVTVTHVTQV